MAQQIKILSMNTATGTDQGAPWRPNLEPHVEEIDDLQPDILLVQEVDRGTVRSGGVDQFEMLKRKTHLKYGLYTGVPYPNWPPIGQYGDAVLSRWPAISTQGVLSEYDGKRTPLPTADFIVYGRRLRATSIHTGPDRTRSMPAAEEPALRAIGDAKLLLGPHHVNAAIGGDFNMGETSRPLMSLRQLMSWRPFDQSDPVKDSSDTRDALDPDLGIDHILFKGLDLRVRNYRRLDNFRQGNKTGTWFSDHPMVLLTADIEPPMEPAFRMVSDWVADRSNTYSAGWATMVFSIDPGIYHAVTLYRTGLVDWVDVPAKELQFRDPRTRFTSAHDWAVKRGYETGFPNFHTATKSMGQVFGTWLVKKGTAASIRDVPTAELGLPSQLENVDFERWLIACDRYAQTQGFSAALPTGHWAVDAQGRMVVGVHFYKDDKVQRYEFSSGEAGESLPLYDR